MSNSFNNDKPIFIQVREIIEDQIVNGLLAEEEQAPSTNQLVSFDKPCNCCKGYKSTC